MVKFVLCAFQPCSTSHCALDRVIVCQITVLVSPFTITYFKYQGVNPVKLRGVHIEPDTHTETVCYCLKDKYTK